MVRWCGFFCELSTKGYGSGSPRESVLRYLQVLVYRDMVEMRLDAGAWVPGARAAEKAYEACTLMWHARYHLSNNPEVFASEISRYMADLRQAERLVKKDLRTGPYERFGEMRREEINPDHWVGLHLTEDRYWFLVLEDWSRGWLQVEKKELWVSDEFGELIAEEGFGALVP